MSASNTAYTNSTSATSGYAARSLLNSMHTSLSHGLASPLTHSLADYSASSRSDNEFVVAGWLSKLLKHFGLSELDGSSEQQLVAMLEQCGADTLAALQNHSLLLDLRHRIMRTAGAKLDSAFVTMSPEVIDEEDAEAISLSVENRKLQGLRYQGEVYRLTDAFLPRHRLQAFCLGQTLSEQKTTFIITQSSERFAVWVNVRAFPRRSYLSSANHSSKLGR